MAKNAGDAARYVTVVARMVSNGEFGIVCAIAGE